MNPLKLLPFEKIADKLCDSAQTQLKEQQDRIREGEMPPGVDPRRGLTKDEVKATLREEAREAAASAAPAPAPAAVQQPSTRRSAGCPCPPRSFPAAWPCGFYGGVIVLCAISVKLHRAFGVSSLFAFTIPHMIVDVGMPETHFSSLYGAATFGGALLQPRWGRMIDRHGARVALPGFVLMLGAGLAGITVAAPWLGWVNYPLLFFAWTAMRTTAIGALDNVSNTMINQVPLGPSGPLPLA